VTTNLQRPTRLQLLGLAELKRFALEAGSAALTTAAWLLPASHRLGFGIRHMLLL
jgi:hypothetical protein